MHKSKADSPAARSLFGAFSRGGKSWQSWQFGRKQIKKKFGHLTPNFDITNEQQVSYHGLKKYLFTRQSGHLVWLATWKVAALTNALCPTHSNFAGRKKRSHKHSGGQGTVWQKKKEPPSRMSYKTTSLFTVYTMGDHRRRPVQNTWQLPKNKRNTDPWAGLQSKGGGALPNSSLK